MIRAFAKKASTQRALLGGFNITRAFFSSAPETSSVKDLLISLTFVDPSGARRKVTGLIGKR